MASNDALIERIREVNPIPNNDESLLSTAALLTAIDQRSGDKQTDTVDTQPVKPPAKTKRRLVVAAVAFAAALGMVGVVALLTTSGDDASVTADTPPATTAATPATVDPWEMIPPIDGTNAGELRTTTFAIPFSFHTESLVYGVAFEREDWLALAHPFGVIARLDVVLGLDTIEDTVDTFRAIHDLYPEASMTDPEPVTLGGARGVVFETIGLPSELPGGADHPFIATSDSFAWTVGLGGGEIFVVDVNGQTVVVGYGATDLCPGCPSIPTQGQLDAAKARLRALIDTIDWRDLS